MSLAVVAVSAQHAAQYPAGVDPALCPGFPICDNARLHDPKAAATLPIHDNPLWNAHAVPGVPTTLTPAAPAVAPQPQWNTVQNIVAPQPQWNAIPVHQVWNFAPAHIQDQFSQWRSPVAVAVAAPQQVAVQAQPQPQPQPQQYAAVETNEINDTAGGDKYPAGVNPQACPNYPYCDTNTGLHAGVVAAPKAAPLPGFTERQYPAGVSAQQCPNFPYCG